MEKANKYTIITYGCQMNEHDSEKIAYILEKEHLDPAECLMVGDREHDILGARQNGIETIAVEYGYGSDEELTAAQPKARIQSFAELLDHLN